MTAARYRVKSYPTVLVLQKDGTEIDRVVGYVERKLKTREARLAG